MRESAYSKMVIVLVGNKTDLKDEREVSLEEGQRFADTNNLIFFETSAKTGENVESTFMESAGVINDNIKNGVYDMRTENIGIKPGNMFKPNYVSEGSSQKSLVANHGNDQQKSSGCCG